MNKFTYFSITAILLAIACVVLTYLGYHYAAMGLGLVSTFLAFAGGMRESYRWQACTYMATCVIYGYSIAPSGHYLLAISFLFLSFIGMFRVTFYKQMALTKFQWLEPVSFMSGVALYIIGNTMEGTGWAGWVFPLPWLAGTVFKTFGVFTDIKEFAALGKLSYGAKVGSPAPAFSLPDQDGNNVSLADYKDKRHVLLLFVRGDWCPTCHIMLRTYERNKEKFEEKNIMLLAIGPDPLGVNKDMVHRLGVDYKVLSDEKQEALKSYGMLFQGNSPFAKYKEGVPLPAAFLVNMKGTIVFSTDPRKAGEIMKPDAIFSIIEKIS